ncbi:unnamed protein product [Bemisia tabaci]|uniref:Cytochrome b5 heme-binding domain-containing protein n=1 Tax=Bemisia tabaci TaxID=7038 RepID=A0A9P0F8Q5_BEMTA|nr:unnamed protein product [Bemisia tabaci]
MLKLSIIVACISILLFYLYSFNNLAILIPSLMKFASDVRHSIVRFSEEFINEKYLKNTTSSERLFSISDLSDFNGETRKELYLAILGNVFDVTQGQKFYGRGESYHHFIGKDASRAFVTGELSKSMDNDDVADLSLQEIKSIHDWLNFYHDKYLYKGKLIGRYYDATGSPTDYNFKIQGLIEKALIDQDAELEEKKKFPPCNVEWSESTGTRVWCSKKSGGIERDWVGVPRKLYTAGDTKPRCACINLRSKEKEIVQKGTLRDKNLEEYKNCDPKATSCIVID